MAGGKNNRKIQPGLARGYRNAVLWVEHQIVEDKAGQRKVKEFLLIQAARENPVEAEIDDRGPKKNYYCPECGTRVYILSNYCPGCGQRIGYWAKVKGGDDDGDADDRTDRP